jgi:hypothetical protein
MDSQNDLRLSFPLAGGDTSGFLLLSEAIESALDPCVAAVAKEAASTSVSGFLSPFPS